MQLYSQNWLEGKLPFHCRLISRTVWKAVKPSAVLLTGDLVDGKNRNGGGRQSECEWQVPPPPSRGVPSPGIMLSKILICMARTINPLLGKSNSAAKMILSVDAAVRCWCEMVLC
jgi:hypothetical protein